MTGDAAVPPGDDDTTGHEIVTQCCNEIDVRVLDHIVVGAAECVSFAERGLI